VVGGTVVRFHPRSPQAALSLHGWRSRYNLKTMLVLASASSRRQELLRNAAIPFTTQPADVDETPFPGESARTCAERLAKEKALKIARHHAHAHVLGADTVVVVDDQILNKPVDFEDAVRMLRLLSGRVHQVITGVCLVNPLPGPQRPLAAKPPAPAPYTVFTTDDRQLLLASETTSVTMSEISEAEIREYVATGEPMDKAGAYAIQGRASRWIPRIMGDYSNVVGLPVALVYRMLAGK
jgi:septum formation protein